MHFHQLSFDLWAKGAYPVIDAGDERFLGYGGSSIYGHTTWLFYEDGEERWIDRDTKGQYGETCKNPAYITTTLTSNDLDFLEGRMDVTSWYNYPDSGDVKKPFSVTRDMVMVGDDYFIVADSLVSNGENRYSMIIPFGSANGHTGAEDNPSDNWALGSLNVDGSRIHWYDYINPKPLNSRVQKASNMVWETVTETNDIETTPYPVNMTVHLNPTAEIDVDVSGMHYGDYGQGHEWAFPYVRVNQQGNNVKYLTVYYPTSAGEKAPDMRSLSVAGGSGTAYATRIGYDVAMVGDGVSITAENLTSDARMTYMRLNGGLPSAFLMVDGYRLNFENNTYVYSTLEATVLVIYGRSNVTAKIRSGGPLTLYLKTFFNSSTGAVCKLNGSPISCAYDGVVVKAVLTGSGEFSVGESDAGEKPGPSIFIPDTPSGGVRSLRPPPSTIPSGGGSDKGGVRNPPTLNLAAMKDKVMRYKAPLDLSLHIILIVFVIAFAAMLGAVYFYVKKASR
jgi:hypothetical protein